MNDIPLTPPVKTPLRCLPALCICLICLLAPTAWAQTELLFWHSHDATSDTIEAFAEAFNNSQSDYTIIPEYVGNFEEAGIRLLTAYGGGNHPVLFSAEMTVIPRLLEEGILVDLTHLTQDITEDDVADFVPMLWNYGVFDAKRYSLPFANSALVLFYNANLLEQKNVSPPTTWEEFEQATSELSTRRIKAFINVNIPLAFEAMVATRGGNIIQDDLPNFNSPEAGRDHHPRAFTLFLAGAGVRAGTSYGATDDFSFNVAENGVDVHDLQATILHLMGLDHERLTYRYLGRDFRLTDVHGRLVRGILA